MANTQRPDTHENGPGWDAVAALDPELLQAYRRLSEVPWANGTLAPKVKELVALAADCVVPGIDADGVQAHMKAALALGATSAEIVEVLELVSILGVHTATMATPILLEEMAALGLKPPGMDNPAAQRVRADFERRRGYWSPLWEAVASFAPEFLQAYLDYSVLPVERGALDAGTRELVLIVANSVTTHLNPAGVRIHIRNALQLGVTGAEIMEVFQLLATAGFRTCTVAFPILAAETRPRHSTVDRATPSSEPLRGPDHGA
ncbi:carboxymuconolactone decarboxylase family protein [Streptomyces sp. NPDC057580]|uniref:carboxymuconolactone decarboxylase family protein n=1 Tax=Streptomyces sp. NPDC057580 TaxID=3346173 RepID=UPI0036B51059